VPLLHEFHRDSSNQDNLKKVVINFFTADEILTAKDVLWANVNGLGDKRMRRDSNIRMHQDADLSDILAAFKKIDEDKLDTPLFVARRLDRLPRHGPEETNVFSLADRIATMERELAAVKVDVNRVKAGSQINSFATVAAIPAASNPHCWPVYTACTSCSSPAAATTETAGTAAESAAATAAAKQDQQRANNDDGFIPARNRRDRRRKRVTVVGTKASEREGCRPRLDLFVSRVPKEYPEQHVRDMIVDNRVEILDIVKVSHEKANMTSYKVTIWADDEDRLMQPDAWPRFISCCRFVRPRRTDDRRAHDRWNRDDNYDSTG
jgi:hypothetical protein